MSDPYLDPQSGILRNKFGLNDQASLDRAEANAVAVRSILFQGNPLKGDFDSQHLKQVHQYLFQDVYEWAGQFRTISMVKADYVDGGRVTRFTPPDLIEQELTTVFQNLARDGFLKGLPRKDFAQKMAMRTNRALDRSAPLNAFKTVAGFREEKICFEGEQHHAKHHRKKRRLQPHHAQIAEYLEKGVRPWVRPWNAEHAAGRITRPLRFNGQPYSGINVLSLWMSADSSV